MWLNYPDLEHEYKDPDPGNFVTNEDESLRLKWTAYLEFTQNQDVGDMTWDKVATWDTLGFGIIKTVSSGPNNFKNQNSCSLTK